MLFDIFNIFCYCVNTLLVGQAGMKIGDEQAMEIALEEARLAAKNGDVPVGAVLMLDGDVVARSRNQVKVGRDPTLHAEVIAIRQAASLLGEARLCGTTLVVTMEPCLMCAGAILLARISRLVYGCDDPKAGAVRSLYTTLSDPRLNHRCKVTAGVMAGEASKLLQDFFGNLRKVPMER